MNNFFNIKRFGLILKKDFMENGSRYLLYFVGLIGVMALFMIPKANDAYDYCLRFGFSTANAGLNTDLLTIATITFLAGGVLFASTAMYPMRNKIKRTSFLIIPTSNFEKYFSRWLIVTVGYIIAFFLALWFADLIRVAVCSARYPDLIIQSLDLNRLVYPEDKYDGSFFIPKSVFQIGLATYFLFQSLFLLGSQFWEKLSFVKTFAVCALIITAFILICRWTLMGFYDNIEQFGNVLSSFHPEERMTEEQATFTSACILTFFALVNWVISYFRFKESEIIKRW